MVNNSEKSFNSHRKKIVAYAMQNEKYARKVEEMKSYKQESTEETFIALSLTNSQERC